MYLFDHLVLTMIVLDLYRRTIKPWLLLVWEFNPISSVSLRLLMRKRKLTAKRVTRNIAEGRLCRSPANLRGKYEKQFARNANKCFESNRSDQVGSFVHSLHANKLFGDLL